MNSAGKFQKKEWFLNLDNWLTGKVMKLMEDVATFYWCVLEECVRVCPQHSSWVKL